MEHKHKESSMQQTCATWFRLQYPEYRGLLFSVPNGAHVSDCQRRILIAEGLISGVSDMILLLPRDNYHALMIEFKVGYNRQSESQKRWQQLVEQKGYKYIVIRSFEQFKDAVDTYIGEPTEKYNIRIIKQIVNKQ